MTNGSSSGSGPGSRGFRETGWFAEGNRQSEAHDQAAKTGEELPAEIRTLDERYAEHAPVSPEERALSLRTGKTGSGPAVTTPPAARGRDSTYALKAIVRTPGARIARTLLGLTLAVVLGLGALVAAAYLRPAPPPGPTSGLDTVRAQVDRLIGR